MLPSRLPEPLQQGLTRHLPPVWAALLLTPVLTLVPAAIVQIVLVAPLLGDAELPLDLTAQTLVLLSYLGVWFALWAWLRHYEGRALASIGLTRAAPLRQLFGGVMIAVGVLGLTVVGVALVGGVGLEPTPSLLLPALFSLIGWSVQASAEEAVFRGWLLPVLSARRSPAFGLLLSSLLFALLHGANLGFSPVAFVNIALVGVLSGLYVLQQGSLWGVIGLHVAFNWLQGNLLGLPVSGAAFEASFLQTTVQGPALVTGGTFGLEGSLLTTLFLLVACGVVAGWLRRETTSETTTAETE